MNATNALVFTAAFVALALAAGPAAAHEVGLSRGEYALEGDTVHAELTFARREIAGAVDGVDADPDGTLAADELARAREPLEAALVRGISLRGDGEACTATLEDARLAEQDGIVLHANFRCAAPPRQLSFAF